MLALMVPVMVCMLPMLAFRLDCSPDMRSRFSSSARAVATRRGTSELESPRSTVRSAASGNGGSVSTPLKARMRVSPTTPRSIVKMLEVRSHLASLAVMSIRMRTLPWPSSTMFCTRPIGKPENVKSMPTCTPSESSVISTRRWVFSNTPRATRT